MKFRLSPSDALRAARLQQNVSENDRVLRLLSDYLNLTPRLLDRKTVLELAEDCSVSPDDAFRTLLCACLGLNIPDSPDDRRLERLYFQPGLRRLSPDIYLNDAYTRTVRFSELSVGRWHFTHGEYLAYEPFVCGHPVLTSDFREIPQLGYFDSTFRFPSVTENGVEWMTVTPNEVETMGSRLHRHTGAF